ncbi:hypothetical protein D3C87_79990 [compost metagenome]
MKKEPSLFGEVTVFIASFLGFYKKIKIDNSEVRIPRRIYKNFECKIESLIVMSSMYGYHVHTEEYILYNDNPITTRKKDSFVISKRITTDYVNNGFVFEMKFNVWRKTLKRCYVSKIGRYKYYSSRRNKHVKNNKDIECIDQLIKML